MIRELGNVELFELCETVPKVQCSHCHLHWNQGIVYCTCGQFFVDSESRRKFDKLRLDALSIPNYVIKKGPTHGAGHGKTEEQKECHIAWNAWKRCCKKVDSQGGHFTGIHDRYLRDPVIVNHNSQSDGQNKSAKSFDACKRRPYISSHSRGTEMIPRTLVSHLEQVRQKWACETSIRFSSCFLYQKSSTLRVRRKS